MLGKVCCKCNTTIPEEDFSSYFDHFFSGYGFAYQYCSKCCPKEFDGMVCEGKHI